ncbi:MAG TPA: rhomboid family intramembrane serine protease [Rhodanobacteraceae bacterium]|nr:rhomboid family intramembrane serine protease [Rhodanobacteraceae bacterium]
MFVQLEQRRRSRFPWATLLLVAACVACYVWFSLVDPVQRGLWVARWGTVPARLLEGRWYSELLPLLTSLFIHVNWLHVLGNLLFLVIFSVPAERALGPRRLLFLFLVGGALANLAGALTLGHTSTPIVGCSGAVSAVVGAYLGLFPRARLGLVLPLGIYFQFVQVPALVLIGIWVLVQLLFTWVGPSFDAVVWWAHIGGFVFGLGYAAVARPALARERRR